MKVMAEMHPNYQPILDTRQNRLSFELSRGDGIDSKILGVFGANIAVLIFIAQAGLQLNEWQWAALVVPFMVSLLMNMMMIVAPAQYQGNVSVTDHPEYLSMDEEDLLLQLIADTEGAIEENMRLNARRSDWCTWSIGVSLIGVVFLAILV